jgi:glycosyltransferase involved in cell wall biosynthesis
MHDRLASKIFTSSGPDAVLICFSHLRWDFVFQRPQHLLTRASDTHNVLYFEEPIFDEVELPAVYISAPTPRIRVVTPVLPNGTTSAAAVSMQKSLVDELLAAFPSYKRLVAWYYTPIALPFSAHLQADIRVYDCMDELSSFKDAPAELARRETALFAAADLVFAGGQSLYAAKRGLHPRVYAFPSSIDASHFNRARDSFDEPADQAGIGYPRIGFFGVIDERMDLDLVAATASQMPEYQFVMLGPVVKIDPASLPQAPNLHWLGGKSYDELPAYLAHWTAGWMPFALNESTRYISPTKTPEFLAAGLPVVSTAIADVVRPYGAMGLVQIAGLRDMAAKLAAATRSAGDHEWLKKVDAYIAGMSWDRTWEAMAAHLDRIHSLNGAALMRKGA